MDSRPGFVMKKIGLIFLTNPTPCMTLLLIFAMALCPERSSAEDLRVTEQDGVVKDGNGQDATKWDTTTATPQQQQDGPIKIETVTFKPPLGWSFIKFKNSERLVEPIPNSIEGIAADIDSGPQAIKITWTDPPGNGSADKWPLRAEGVLEGPGGDGPGQISDKYWAALILADDLAAEIQVHNTASDDDDYVQIHSTFPENRFTEKVRIRLLTDSENDVEVELSSRNGRLRFPENATKTVTLPKTGAWVDFEVSGENGSTSAR